MCNKRIVPGRKFIATASVVYPVGMTIKQKMIIRDNFKLMRITATQMIAQHSPSKC